MPVITQQLPAAPSIDNFNVVIPAKGTYPINSGGDSFFVQSSDGVFYVQIDNGRPISMQGGRSFDAPFDRLNLINRTSSAISVNVYVCQGGAKVNDNAAVAGSNLSNFNDPFKVTNPTPGTPVPLAAGTTWFRKAKIVARRDNNGLAGVANTGNVGIGFGDRNSFMCGMVLAPGDEVTLEPPADSAWDFNQIWFDVQNAGDGIAVVLWC